MKYLASLGRFAVPIIILALVAGAAVLVLRTPDRTEITAYFPRTISIFEGSDVRVLGVPVGKVETVEPEGTQVKVKMYVDQEGVQVPDDASAVIIAPSVVGDRYVQLTPAFSEGDTPMATGTTLDEDRTEVPLELDQIYDGLNDLSVALGPEGANANGALSDLLTQTARNFGGQGERFNQTVTDLGALTQTLDNNKENLFDSVDNIDGFVQTLADNDQTVRDFSDSLADVSDLLADEREDLGEALDNLGTATTAVSRFVRNNRQQLGRNIRGLRDVTQILVDRRVELDEVLRTAPIALNNLGGTYNRDAGTLDTRANLQNGLEDLIRDPANSLCTLLNLEGPDSVERCQDLLGPIIPELPAARTAPLGQGAGGGFRTLAERETFDPTLGGLVEVSDR
ncbi:MCE family protein [Nocardioides sp. CFH 31398]|uniref:MCE family protein n=1 Tax=Nocardioides sp. CFH 31398 TaxID=2919579 RepID=UPI001F0550E0|nr:MCE family protein [Nocardioides sp. CFH 31398]MCH1865239.1 MCE family protein [Nocardioides sp. CFH 31398]